MDSIEDRFIVLLEDGADPHEVAARHGVDPFLIYERTPRYCGFAAQLTEDTREALAVDPEVRAIEADQIVTAHGDITNGVARIEASLNAVWLGGVAVDVDVAILDTGIDSSHTDLDVVGGDRFVTGGQPGNYQDEAGHGTHVAGTVAALDNGAGVVGVAPGARLWAGKVLNKDGKGTTATAAAGLNWAVGLGIPVANMSLGAGAPMSIADCATSTSILHLAVCNAYDNGTTVVVSAGNDARDSVNDIPAAYDEVITVSALADFDGLPGGLVANDDPVNGIPVSDSGWSPDCTRATGIGYPTQQDDTLAEFSNFGAAVDVIAPGFCIVSTYPGGYAWNSGTSMAAPHVTGAVAVYLHDHPGATVDQVRAALLERANPHPCDGVDGVCAGDGDAVQEPLAFLGHLDDSFERDTVNSVPAHVSATNGNGTAVVTAADADGSGDSGSQSLTIDTASLSIDPDYAAVRFCLPDYADTHFHASFSVNFQQLVDWNPIAIFGDGSPGEMLYWWWVDAAGLVADDQLVGTVTTGGWHRVTIDIDRDAGTASFDVDGSGVTSALTTWESTPSTPMKCLAFSTWPDELQSVAVDDVLVTSFDY